MATSDERRAAADRLRRMADDSMHGLSFQNAIKECVCDGSEGSVSWRGVMRRLADLIDPTCELKDPSYGKDSLLGDCSACGARVARMTVQASDGYVHHKSRYCPNCGARVVGHRE